MPTDPRSLVPQPSIKYTEASARGEVVRVVPEIREFRRRAVRSVSPELREEFYSLWLEFGTWLGGSALDIEGALPIREQMSTSPHLHCFDSWEGLPEDWGEHAAGTFGMQGRVPDLPGCRCHKGWFMDTLPGFLAAHPGPVAFVHIDCDLYESARFVIVTLREAGRLVSGSVVLFDELWGHPSWQHDEYRVLVEELLPHFDCELVAVAPDLKRAAFRLHAREATQ